MVSKIEREYKRLQSNVPLINKNRSVTYVSPVNFSESMETERHRWFPYKEGFSPSFVSGFLDKYSPNRKCELLDPFAGVGTTLIVGASKKNSCLGFEVNPVAHFLASVKSLNFSIKERTELLDAINLFKSNPINKKATIPKNSTVISYFEEDALDALLGFKHFYLNELEGKTQKVFKLVFLNLIEIFSTHRKAGNGVKKRTRLLYERLGLSLKRQLKLEALSRLKIIYEDLNKVFLSNNIELLPYSSLQEEKYPNRLFDIVLTSPPYANCFDYSKIYICELWLGDFYNSDFDQKEFRKHSIRSHVHAKWDDRHTDSGSEIINEFVYPILSDQKLWSKQIPQMLKGYFEDMGYLLKILNPKLSKNATIGMVVSNSVYGGIPIATDLLLTELGHKYGYQPIGIEVYRSIIPSSQQYQSNANKDYFRESLVILKKK